MAPMPMLNSESFWRWAYLSRMGSGWGGGAIDKPLERPPHPQHKDIDIGPWTTSGGEYLTNQSVALELLEVSSRLNYMCYFFVGVGVAFSADSGVSNLVRAKNVKLLEQIAKDFLRLLASASVPIAEAPLATTIAFCRQWASTVAEFCTCASDALLRECADGIVSQSRCLDALCPRWGDSIDDHKFREDGARLQLLANKDMQQIPQSCRKLQEMLGELKGGCLQLTGALPSDCDATREATKVGGNSLAFGKRTVNVGAAVRIVFTQPPARRSIAAVLQFRDGLPKTLIRRLEALLAEEPSATSPPPKASGGTASASGGRHAASAATGIKRSGSDLGAGSTSGVKRQK